MPILQILTTAPNRVVLTLDPSVPPPRVTPLELEKTLYRVVAFLPIDTLPWLTWITCLALPKQSKVNISSLASFIDLKFRARGSFKKEDTSQRNKLSGK